MTTLPSEINVGAVKNSPAEKIAPTMPQCVSPVAEAEASSKSTPIDAGESGIFGSDGLRANDGQRYYPKTGTVALVTNPIVVPHDVALPFEIAPGIVFDRASLEEIDEFKRLLPKYYTNTSAEWFEHHEYEGQEVDLGNGATRWETRRLDESEWRYFVMRTPDNGGINIDLHLVCNITSVSLDLTTLYIGSYGCGYSPYTGLRLYGNGDFLKTQLVTSNDLCEIAEVFALAQSVAGTVKSGGRYPDLYRAMNMLNELETLPSNSKFQVIGLFSIIEMLITHNPKLEDRGDSISHQVRTKMPLLERRFDRDLSFADYFDRSLARQKVWNKLYSLRSAIAHGGSPDFSTGDLAPLRNEENAVAFLNLAVKALIRNALREPDLYHDLREC